MMKEIIVKTRSFRRFKQDRPLDGAILRHCIECARLGGSARNCQPWQYGIVTDPHRCADIFPYLGWAGYLSDWPGPVEGERPSAYILCVLNRLWLKGNDQEAQFDLGIATQNMLLAAMENNIGGCRIGAFSAKLAGLFTLAEHQELSLVIALGYPAETVVIETISNNDIRYWRDEKQTHHVPKRSLDDIIISL
jgi:nitroreductase